MVQAKHESLQSQHAALERQKAQLQGAQGALQVTLDAKTGSADLANQSARDQASEHAGELARAHAELQAVKEDRHSDLQQKASQVCGMRPLFMSKRAAHRHVTVSVIFSGCLELIASCCGVSCCSFKALQS